MNLSIIVPTYNERENLPNLAERVHDSLRDLDYELIIVDDHSPDGTGELAEELSRDKPIKVIHRQGKLGLASAIVEGFRQAEGDVLGVIDADLQHPPEKIPELLRKIGGADIAIASRYVDGGGVEGWTFTRKMISHFAKIMPQFLFAKIRSVKDPLSGFFLFKSKVIEGVDLNPIGYKILLEILIEGKHKSTVEVPYVFKEREKGVSCFNTSEQINYLRHLYRLIRKERETERFIKFLVVGGSGVLVNEGLLALLTEWGFLPRLFGLPYLLPAAISIETSVLNNFLWNEIWTFRDRRTSMPKSVISRAGKFNLVSLLSLALNMGVLTFFTEVFGVYYLVSEIFGIVAATAFNFTVNKWWTWQ